MSSLTWEHLAKNSEDSEKIEEAIDRIVQDHNDDPEAHLGEGQSLQSHKASEIIDHLAKSIISDKIKDWSVSEKQLSNESAWPHLSLESFDIWDSDIDEADGVVDLINFGVIRTRAGSTLDATAYASIYSVKPRLEWEKNPWFQCYMYDSGDVYDDFGVRCGAVQVFDQSKAGFGIYFKRSDSKLYGFCLDSNGYSEFELCSITPSDRTFIRVDMDYSKKEIYYYVNGDLEYTYDFSPDMAYSATETPFSVGSRNTNSGAWQDCFFSHMVFNQDV